MAPYHFIRLIRNNAASRTPINLRRDAKFGIKRYSKSNNSRNHFLRFKYFSGANKNGIKMQLNRSPEDVFYVPLFCEVLMI